MGRVEEKIRDYLADNLSFIENGLQLIEKEYKLNNLHGSKGYIDILAKDNYENYVVIEIKRSVQASRQAIHEIIKYTALLKQKHKIKDSEIRIMIISTHWEELLVPFSELIAQTTYYIEGYQIEIDNNYRPVSKTKIVPVSKSEKRGFFRQHIGFYCQDKQVLNSLVNSLPRKLSKSGIENFLLLEMKASIADKYPNPYCAYCVLLKESKERYWEILNHMDTAYDEPHLVEKIEEDIEFGDKGSEAYYLEQEIISEALKEIIKEKNGYFIEFGKPEGFAASIDDWDIVRINRFGFIKDDIRLSDNQIIKEIMGVDGGNSNLFFDICETKFKAKYKEIMENVSYTLKFNEKWEEDIIKILRTYESENAKISLFINNPHNILESLYTAIYTEGATLPYYELIVDITDDEYSQTHIYNGMICWTGKKTSFENIVRKYFRGDEFNIFMYMTMHVVESINMEIMDDLGLEYITNSFVIEENEERIIKDSMSNVERYSILDFYDVNSEFVEELLSLFNNYTNYSLLFKDK
ncbi:endonuclease NucS domain-containing protein [Bacillus cereus group sp. BfR-BA-01330]|uniref:endonuclease NucS domain-containing protein n=1 Tax=Bacillus cereus group sp. BfR-BA-01330 TaxID=2920306 RepID=UPI001F5A7FE7